jgi:hypothetical protein
MAKFKLLKQKYSHVVLQHTQQHVDSLPLMLMHFRLLQHPAHTVRMYQISYSLLAQILVPIFIANEHWKSQYLKVIDRNIVDNSRAGWEL